MIVALTTLVLGGAILLVAAGVSHARGYSHLHATLVTQALLPYPWLRPLATTLVIIELFVGLVAVIAALTPTSVGTAWVFGSLAIVYFAFCGYALVLRTTRPTADCGCFHGSGPVTASVVIRAGLLAMSAAFCAGLATDDRHDLSSMPLLVLGGVTVAVVSYAAPASFHQTAQPKEHPWKP